MIARMVHRPTSKDVYLLEDPDARTKRPKLTQGASTSTVAFADRSLSRGLG